MILRTINLRPSNSQNQHITNKLNHLKISSSANLINSKIKNRKTQKTTLPEVISEIKQILLLNNQLNIKSCQYARLKLNYGKHK